MSITLFALLYGICSRANSIAPCSHVSQNRTLFAGSLSHSAPDADTISLEFPVCPGPLTHALDASKQIVGGACLGILTLHCVATLRSSDVLAVQRTSSLRWHLTCATVSAMVGTGGVAIARTTETRGLRLPTHPQLFLPSSFDR